MFLIHNICDINIFYIFTKKIPMKIHEKIKEVRESKKISQEFIAHKLGLDQSQYSRRESGEIKILAEEIISLFKILETKISELYSEEGNVFNSIDQKGGAFGQYVTIVSDKLIEQFEIRIAEKDVQIKDLKNQLSKTKQ